MALPNPVSTRFGDRAQAVAKSDTDVFEPSILYVGGAGNVAILPADQAGSASPTPVTFVGMLAGSVVPCMAIKLMNTNTTATNIVRVS